VLLNKEADRTLSHSPLTIKSILYNLLFKLIHMRLFGSDLVS